MRKETKYDLIVKNALSISGAVLLRGLPGTGKTSLLEHIAKKEGYEVVFYQCHPGTTEDELLYALIPDDEKRAGIRVQEGVLPKALRLAKEGRKVMLILDEWDKTRPSSDAFLLDFLQNKRIHSPHFSIALNEKEKQNLVVGLTSNDERDLSEPLLRRLAIFEIPPLDSKLVREILEEKHPNSSKQYIDLAEKIYIASLKANLRKPATVQELDQFLTALETKEFRTIPLDELIKIFVIKTEDDFQQFQRFVEDMDKSEGDYNKYNDYYDEEDGEYYEEGEEEEEEEKKSVAFQLLNNETLLQKFREEIMEVEEVWDFEEEENLSEKYMAIFERTPEALKEIFSIFDTSSIKINKNLIAIVGDDLVLNNLRDFTILKQIGEKLKNYKGEIAVKAYFSLEPEEFIKSPLISGIEKINKETKEAVVLLKYKKMTDKIKVYVAPAVSSEDGIKLAIHTLVSPRQVSDLLALYEEIMRYQEEIVEQRRKKIIEETIEKNSNEKKNNNTAEKHISKKNKTKFEDRNIIGYAFIDKGDTGKVILDPIEKVEKRLEKLFGVPLKLKGTFFEDYYYYCYTQLWKPYNRKRLIEYRLKIDPDKADKLKYAEFRKVINMDKDFYKTLKDSVSEFLNKDLKNPEYIKEILKKVSPNNNTPVVEYLESALGKKISARALGKLDHYIEYNIEYYFDKINAIPSNFHNEKIHRAIGSQFLIDIYTSLEEGIEREYPSLRSLGFKTKLFRKAYYKVEVGHRDPFSVLPYVNLKIPEVGHLVYDVQSYDSGSLKKLNKDEKERFEKLVMNFLVSKEAIEKMMEFLSYFNLPTVFSEVFDEEKIEYPLTIQDIQKITYENLEKVDKMLAKKIFPENQVNIRITNFGEAILLPVPKEVRSLIPQELEELLTVKSVFALHNYPLPKIEFAPNFSKLPDLSKNELSRLEEGHYDIARSLLRSQLLIPQMIDYEKWAERLEASLKQKQEQNISPHISH